jgi:hypothetical protein
MTSRVLEERVMGDDPLEKQIAHQMGHKPYARLPSFGRIAIWLVLIAIACGLLLYLAVWAKLIQ